MNIFSRIKSGIGIFGALLRWQRKQAAFVQAEQEAAIKKPSKPRRVFRFRESGGRPIFGPAFDLAREGHHTSRQRCRQFLRVRFFASVSAANRAMSRRERRKWASLFARLEYRRMMSDETNAIPLAEELAARRERLIA